MKALKSALALLLIVMASGAAAAEMPDSVRVLFVGNSYTYCHDMYKMVSRLAENTYVHPGRKVKVGCEARTPGGWSFERHASSEETARAIGRGGYDYVVLQEQSARPAMPTQTVAVLTYPYALRLDSLVHAHNPGARVIFYMTWGHKYGCQDEHDYPLIDSYEGMQNRLATSYLEMAYQTGAMCAPVGLAWQRVRRERPDIILYGEDSSHPSVAGSYLAANVIFCTITGRPYQSYYFAGLEPPVAEYLQQVAQESVLGNARTLNIGAR